MHRLRYMVHTDSAEISDAELNEFEKEINMDVYKEYEYSGNFIITKNVEDRDDAMTRMCCGIIYHDVSLSNGDTLYFAFDYGH